MLSNLIRWSRPASILGVVLLIVRITLPSVLGPAQGTSNLYEIYSLPLYVVYNLLLDAALLLFAVGLVGLHSRQAKRFRQLGRMGLFLGLSTVALLTVSAFATIMVGLWPGFYAPLVLYTQLLAGFCLIIGLVPLSITALRGTSLQEADVRWRRILLILGVGLVAAVFSDVLNVVMQETIPPGIPGFHLLHVFLTIPAAIWVARKFSTAPVLYGTLTGVFSGIANQVFDHIILARLGYYGPMTLREIATILVLCIGAGWLGGIVARSTIVDQETLYRTSRAINAARNRQEVVDAIGQHLSNRQVSHVALWEVVFTAEDDAQIEIELQAAWRPPAAREIWGPEVWRPGLRMNAAQVPALERCLRQRTQQLIQVRKLPHSERAAWEHQGINSFMLLPLAGSGETPTDPDETERIGILMIASQRTTGFFGKGAERTYQTVGTQAALALQNLRLVEQGQQAGVSQERQRLAHEIHDTLAQGFTSIVMKLEAAEETLSHNPTAVQRYIDQARRTARESLAEARHLMWALRSDSLEDASLTAALKRLTDRYSEETRATADTTVIGTPRPLSPEIEVTLLRIAQEALSNIRKHARASQVLITLSYMNNLVLLNVEDNGVGFDPNKPHVGTSDHSGGFGLKGMRRRVEQLSGTLLVDSTPGSGTTLMVALPVGGDKQPNQNAEAAKKLPS